MVSVKSSCEGACRNGGQTGGDQEVWVKAVAVENPVDKRSDLGAYLRTQVH